MVLIAVIMEYLAGITVTFESGALTVSENDSYIEVCLILSHSNLQRSFRIDLTPQSGTATGKQCMLTSILNGFFISLYKQVPLISFHYQFKLNLKVAH